MTLSEVRNTQSDLAIENAVIMVASLEIEGHGLLTSYISLDGECWSQSFGGYNLQAKGENYCAMWITGLFEALGVNTWTELQKHHVRVARNPSMRRIIAIGHIIKDQWFYPEVAMKGGAS